MNTSVFRDRVTFIFIGFVVLSLPYEFFFTSQRKGLFSSLKFLVFIVAALVLARVWVERRDFRASYLLAGAGAVFCVGLVVLAFFFSLDRANSLKFAIKMVIGWLVFLGVVQTLGGDTGRVSRILWIFCANAGIVALIGIGEVAGWEWAQELISIFREQKFFIADAIRLSATLEYPNTAGFFLAQALVLVSFLIGRNATSRHYFLGLPLLVTIAAGLVLTYSRGAWTSALGGLAVGMMLAWCIKQRRTVVVLAVAAGATLLTSTAIAVFNPYVRLRTEPAQALSWFQIRFDFNQNDNKILEPDREYTIRLSLENRGRLPILSAGEDSYELSYRWLDPDRNRIVIEKGLRTRLSENLSPGERLTVDAQLQTPAVTGEYILLWDFYQEKRGWLSARGLVPALVPYGIYADPATRDAEGRGRAHAYIEKYREGERAEAVSADRGSLWRAAWRMFIDHPWTGVGPGNFRLFYGKYLGLPRWDDRFHANNLYLEFLADSGAVGLLLLLGLLGTAVIVAFRAIRFATDPKSRILSLALACAFAAWVIHGWSDYFLEFTPTYLWFWILLGLLGTVNRQYSSR